jgi:hypothetical protein
MLDSLADQAWAASSCLHNNSLGQRADALRIEGSAQRFEMPKCAEGSRGTAAARQHGKQQRKMANRKNTEEPEKETERSTYQERVGGGRRRKRWGVCTRRPRRKKATDDVAFEPQALAGLAGRRDSQMTTQFERLICLPIRARQEIPAARFGPSRQARGLGLAGETVDTSLQGRTRHNIRDP